MTVHLWCPRASESAIHLRDALHTAGISCFKSAPRLANRKLASFVNRVKPDDLWVNWGPPYPDRLNVRSLNWPDETLNKRDQLLRLAVEGVICPEVYDGPGVGRIGRSFKHQCASDLLHNTGRDYYTQKLPFTHEVRIHIFQGLAIHSGLKVKRDDIAHEWIRSSASGWKLDYSKAGSIKQSRRDLAKQAVAALDLDFGAVDIGIVQNGAAAVIEVNTAPGVEGSTIDAYVRHIIRVYEGGR